jgi:hypothetical protein
MDKKISNFNFDCKTIVCGFNPQTYFFIKVPCSVKLYRTHLGLIYGDEQPFYWMKTNHIIKPSGNQATYLKDDTIHYIIRSLKPEDFDKEISLWVKSIHGGRSILPEIDISPAWCLSYVCNSGNS